MYSTARGTPARVESRHAVATCSVQNRTMLNNAFLSMFILCALGCAPSVKELNRYPNQAGTVEAVLATRETGATVATPAEVYLTPLGQPIRGNPVFRADHVLGLELEWEGQYSQLLIRADEARVFTYTSEATVCTASDSQTVGVTLEIEELELE